MGKKLLFLLLIVSIVTRMVYGKTVKMHIIFKTPNLNIASPAVVDAPMTCSGSDNSYQYLYSQPAVNNQELVIAVGGTFEGDKRNKCLLKDDNVYFEFTDFKVSWLYQGSMYTCIINQGIGTSYDTLYGNFSKLQGDAKNVFLSCGNGFYYKVIPGSGSLSNYSPGYILIEKLR